MSADAPRAPADPLVGRTICGCELLALISTGGMGRLYKARQVSLDRIVAVKVLPPALATNEEFLARFRREARALATLLHPNIVAVHNFGEEGDVHALVMEYIEGESVADILARLNILPTSTAVAIVRQIAEGLAFAHEKQVIHCDVKPENILVTPTGTAKLADFGLARSLVGDSGKITRDGVILGTPAYMSPEQCAGSPLDPRTDVYSLGATFYRMVAGRDPFEAPDPFAIMAKHRGEPPDDPRRHNPELPSALAKVILRMMEKPRENRYRTAAEVAEALRAIERTLEPSHGFPDPVPYPRRHFTFVRDALQAGLLSPAQVRECLARQDAAGEPEESDLPALFLRTKLLTDVQVRTLEATARAREEALGDEEFARLALDAGMVTKDQVAECLRTQRGLPRARTRRRLHDLMVAEGILKPAQAASILFRQVKLAQEAEDAELLDILRSESVLTEADIQRCIKEQERLEAEGRIRVLRQIIPALGMLAPARLKRLLANRMRQRIEAHLAELEEAERERAEPIMPSEVHLKLEESEPCPRCHELIEVNARSCPHCGCRVEDARREAAILGKTTPARTEGQEAGAAQPEPRRAAASQEEADWEILLPGGEASRPISFAKLIRLIKEKRVQATTVLRGPFTQGVWRQARHTPCLCRFFGTCHYCDAKVPSGVRACPSCNSDLDRPRGR